MSARTPSLRIIELLLLLLRRPYGFGRGDLAARYEVSVQTIRRDLRTLREAGLDVDVDAEHRYAVLPQRGSGELTRLQPLTDAELARVRESLGRAFAKTGEAEVIARKLESLRDFQRLGLRSLRAPELAKVDALEAAIAARRAVRLVDYRSTNSNAVSPRLIEPFYLDTGNGILHAYDLAREDIRHFRLDRFVRVEALGQPAKHADRHVRVRTDCFRVASDDQVRVHLELDVAARNDLTERFPATLAYLSGGAEEERFDFDAEVNARFYGVLPFCMANWRGVRVRAPEALRAAMRGAAEGILQGADPP